MNLVLRDRTWTKGQNDKILRLITVSETEHCFVSYKDKIKTFLNGVDT